MAEVFELPSTVAANRLDVRYYIYQKRAHSDFRLVDGLALGELCTHVRTRTPKKEHYTDEGSPCVKLRNVTGRVLSLSNVDYIYPHLLDTYVRAEKGDILVNATGEGTAGRVDVFCLDEPHVVTGEILLLRPEGINPYYLAAILRTRFFHERLEACVRGATGQTHLYWGDVSDFEIPSSSIESRYEELYVGAWRLREQAHQSLAMATKVILQALGDAASLDLSSRETCFETDSATLVKAGRMDVEYFQPIHYELASRLLAAGCRTLRSCGVTKRTGSVHPQKDDPVGEYDYIDISGVDTLNGEYFVDTMLGYELPSRAQRPVAKDDLLVSCVRPARNAVCLVGSSENPQVASTGFCSLTTRATAPEELFAILKTEPVWHQLARAATSAMYPAAKPEDVLALLVPVLGQMESELVVEAVRQTNRLLSESDVLLRELEELAETELMGAVVTDRPTS